MAKEEDTVKNNPCPSDSEIMNKTAHLNGYMYFTYFHAIMIVASIIIYISDLLLDIIVAVSYYNKEEYWYCLVTTCFSTFPTIIVQIFSIRWLQMDCEPEEKLSFKVIGLHSSLLGVVYRYIEVLFFGLKARKTQDPLDYQRYYHKRSDVSMLTLFNSFTESAPQLVFQLYVLIVQSQWEVTMATWTGLSALGSLVSLASGVASYSYDMRMIQSEKKKLSWKGMVTQTTWRVGMLSSRVVALVMLCLALNKWAFIVLLLHWIFMTIWVIWQDTDFCSTVWEERLYNGIVGVIYCFCFFNLKEGRSRHRAAAFYAVIILQNFIFTGIFIGITEESKWLGIGALIIVSAGTVFGGISMGLYYGYFHPSGQIKLFSERESYDLEKPALPPLRSDRSFSRGPDFVIEDSRMSGSIYTNRPPTLPPRIKHSRSFKNPCPPKQRFSPAKRDEGDGQSRDTKRDSAYCTDSHVTSSNETYMSIEKTSPMAASTVLASPSSESSYVSLKPGNRAIKETEVSSCHDDTYMSVNPPQHQEESSQDTDDSRITVINVTPQHKLPEKLLKRSPIVKDVTSGFARISPTETVMKKKRDPMTIIVPHMEKLESSDLSTHDYENMALVNINRGTGGVTHWKTYSDVNSNNHDDSASTEKKQVDNSSSTDYSGDHYYDVYPLSRKLKDKLVRSLAPPVQDSDTYEHVEVLEDYLAKAKVESKEEEDEDPDYELRVPVPVTLIHHDGEKISTKRVISMENLKDVISKHVKVPMDDPQDRGDLYILAPMRLLEPILEESESESNRSIMTAITDFLNKTYSNASEYGSVHADGRFAESTDSGGSSSLVQTIDEIRNQSLCNLYYPLKDGAQVSKKSNAVPQVPPRNSSPPRVIRSYPAPDPGRNKKVPVSTSVGSRRNILDLTGNKTNAILNTPSKKSPPRNLTLSPSAKYDDQNTPTPPPFSRSNTTRAPTRRRNSLSRSSCNNTLRPDEKYENPIASRGAWTSTSLNYRIDTRNLSQKRNGLERRSMSILDPKEPPRPLAPKPPLRERNVYETSTRIFSQNI